jgi:hypothetical protein
LHLRKEGFNSSEKLKVYREQNVGKIGKREYLNNVDSKRLMEDLNRFFESNVEISRMRMGKRQTLETLISEEALLFAKYLRNEIETWKPRIPSFQ